MKVIIFKPIEACNSNCIYCDVVKKKVDTRMSEELLELTFRRIGEYLEEKPGERIQLIWHGGEPCLLPPEYFRKALEYQHKYCNGKATSIEHAIQSNLTIITQEHIAVLKDMGIRTIGTSYDPEPGIRGPGKKRDSEWYNKNFFKGIRMLDDHGISWGIIYVITRHSLKNPLDIFYFLTNIKLGAGPCLNPVKLYHEDKHNLLLTHEELAGWYGTVFKEWYIHQERYPHIRPFEMIMNALESGNPSLGCEDSGQCAYNWAYIGPDGETSQCGRAGDHYLLSYGNIKNKTLQEVFTDKQRDLIARRNEVLTNGPCKDCRFWGLCHGGCPLDTYIKYHDFRHKYPNCKTRKLLFEKYIEPITGLKADFRYQPAGEHINT